ncbi:MAG: 4Fe-4S binding protein [Bacteroidales bacterium]|nr:4Fe-4S binding protein [Bacteroidales bacterium]
MDKPIEIVILSGKGGTGKTFVTSALASLAENAVFTDCDVDAADLHLVLTPDIYKTEDFASGSKAIIEQERCTLCGLCKDLCRYQAINFKNNQFEIDEFACEGCGLCAVACPAEAIRIVSYNNNKIYHATTRFGPMVYGKLGIAEENSGRLVSKIRQYAKELAMQKGADYIITDGPPGIGCPVISSVTGADLVIAVTEPTLSGWHDLERLLGLINGFKTPVKVIINKYDLNKQMADNIERNLEKSGVTVIGKIPYDESIVYALIEGKTIREYSPDSQLAKQFNVIWNQVKSSIYEPDSI